VTRKRSLKLLEVYVDTLQHAVFHCLDDGCRDCRERDGSRGDKALEGAEGNGDNIQLAFFIAQHMTTGRMKCSVYQSSVVIRVKLGIARRFIGKASS
jgi:hypothetical protein